MDTETLRIPVELIEQEWVRLQQLIVVDMVEETRKQPPATDFTASFHPLAMKLHKAREAAITKR